MPRARARATCRKCERLWRALARAHKRVASAQTTLCAIDSTPATERKSLWALLVARARKSPAGALRLLRDRCTIATNSVRRAAHAAMILIAYESVNHTTTRTMCKRVRRRRLDKGTNKCSASRSRTRPNRSIELTRNNKSAVACFSPTFTCNSPQQSQRMRARTLPNSLRQVNDEPSCVDDLRHSAVVVH